MCHWILCTKWTHVSHFPNCHTPAFVSPVTTARPETPPINSSVFIPVQLDTKSDGVRFYSENSTRFTLSYRIKIDVLEGSVKI